jgi:hypothetical protein
MRTGRLYKGKRSRKNKDARRLRGQLAEFRASETEGGKIKNGHLLDESRDPFRDYEKESVEAALGLRTLPRFQLVENCYRCGGLVSRCRR